MADIPIATPDTPIAPPGQAQVPTITPIAKGPAPAPPQQAITDQNPLPTEGPTVEDYVKAAQQGLTFKKDFEITPETPAVPLPLQNGQPPPPVDTPQESQLVETPSEPAETKPSFDQLADLELRERRLTQREAAFQYNKAPPPPAAPTAPTAEDFTGRPVDLLESQGMTYEDATRDILRDGNSPAERQIVELQRQLTELQTARKQEAEKGQQQATEQAAYAQHAQLATELDGMQGDFPMIHAFMGTHDGARYLLNARDYYRNVEGLEKTLLEVAQETEVHFIDRMDRAQAARTPAATEAPPQPSPETPQPVAQPRINNRTTASPQPIYTGSHSHTEEAAQAGAAAMLVFNESE